MNKVKMSSRIRSLTYKLRSNKAFTIAEALVATIIMLLVTTIVVAGIPAAIRAYDNVVLTANAEVLLSTSMSVLKNEIGAAKRISVREDGTTIDYYNEGRGSMSQIYTENNGKIMLQRYAVGGDTLGQGYDDARPLVSDEASDKDKGLYVTFESAVYNDGVVQFKTIAVHKNNGDITSASRDTYSVRVITE